MTYRMALHLMSLVKVFKLKQLCFETNEPFVI